MPKNGQGTTIWHGTFNRHKRYKRQKWKGNSGKSAKDAAVNRFTPLFFCASGVGQKEEDNKMLLLQYLNYRDISISDFARVSGLSKATIHNLCTYKRSKITLDTAIRVQLATRNLVKVADLYGITHTKKVSREIEKNLNKFDL